MPRFLGLALVLAVVAAAPAPAQLAPATGAPRAAAGQINPDGSIEHGSGFTATRLGPGQYEIRFPNGYFSSGCAAMVIEGTTAAPSFPILSDAWQRRCPQRQPAFRVNTYDKTGLLSDQSFAFIAVQE